MLTADWCSRSSVLWTISQPQPMIWYYICQLLTSLSSLLVAFCRQSKHGYNKIITEITREVMSAFACQIRTFGFISNQLFRSGTSKEEEEEAFFYTITTNTKNTSLFKQFVDHGDLLVCGLYLECRANVIKERFLKRFHNYHFP